MVLFVIFQRLARDDQRGPSLLRECTDPFVLFVGDSAPAEKNAANRIVPTLEGLGIMRATLKDAREKVHPSALVEN